MKTRNTLVLILWFLLFGITGAGKLIAQQIYYNGSMQYATGSYFFSESTQSFNLSNGLSLTEPNYNISFSVPYVVQSSPWVSYGGMGGIPTGGTQNERVGQHYGHGQNGQGMGGRRMHIDLPDTTSFTKSGFSDPLLSAGFKILGMEPGATAVRINMSIKFPIASPNQGFGTGAWDAGAGVSVFKRMNTWFMTGNLMYWYFGDMSGLELKNSWSCGAGIVKSFAGGDWMVLGSFNAMTAIIEEVNPPVSAGLGISHRVGERTSLNIGAFLGLSESSSDVAFVGGWQFRLK